LTAKFSKEKVLQILASVLDPEIPVVSVVDMGIIRDVRWQESDSSLHVDITPTYSGCPAMQVIEEDVSKALRHAGYQRVVVNRVFSPAWTTDWMSEEGKKRLKKYGIAPPQCVAAPTHQVSDEPVTIGARKSSPTSIGREEVIPCPFCDSQETELRSQFGATACKAFYFCNACRQPFEYFKPI
jgi:ring-1,2-phenylacetyl-CoA epoxidase subunit PaaD